MDIDSNNPSLNESEEIEEAENNPSLNDIDVVEEPKKGMRFSSKQEVYSFYAKYAKHLGFAVAYRTQNIGHDGEVRVTLQKDERFKLTTVMLEHTHDLIPSDSRHFEMNKRILTLVKRRLEINDEAEIGVARNFHSIVVEAGGEWLSCMSNVPPKAIIIDRCRAMQNATEVVFPQARHRWCLWHIMKKIPEKLRGYAQYESIKFALQNAVYDCFTKDEFDEEWEAMIAKFKLDDNEWLGLLYSEPHRWIPAYVKDVFWAGMSTTQRSESMNAFFDGYVNSKATLKQFVEQYDNALRSKVEKEMEADFKSRNKLYDC
ncbi:protein FAR1-RELATED SEQUENCE 5-like [Camellia sinensis]|uniref:protein FAR1-RELATED SEQUENCE 5-like n=1 Tax=Camellia sinensis TaxID=4442 RepID=UPI0010360DEF|nr:protein FAR1-RELATED SEQUENCE 5-like [Camellia sinensis]